jgi:Fungalysin metallopeptidase (M36)
MVRRVVPFAVAVATVLALLPGRVGAATTSGPAGRIFLPNPVVTLRDQSLTDRKDADYAALQPAYWMVHLDHLDGSGYLQGDFVTVRGTSGRAFEADERFLFGRDDPRFEQVMAYYAITRAQEYIERLGFTDIQSDGITVKVDQYGVDNSYFDPTKDLIRLGKGGVDDAEDLEVIWHEYGHAIQEAESPGFGEGHDAGSIGEGFGDYWAATMSQPVSDGYGVTCIADWDSVSYTVDVPHCLRRVDTDLTVDDETGRIHHDGQIWSRALWDIHRGLGRTTADRIILTAQYHFNASTTFRDAALEVIDAARSVGGTSAAGVARTAFEDRGIL